MAIDIPNLYWLGRVFSETRFTEKSSLQLFVGLSKQGRVSEQRESVTSHFFFLVDWLVGCGFILLNHIVWCSVVVLVVYF